MAITVTERERFVAGDRTFVAATVTFDSSYPTGGEAITPANFGLFSHIDWVLTNKPDVATKEVWWDRANSKLMILAEDAVSGIEAQAGNTSDQSAVDVEVFVIGI